MNYKNTKLLKKRQRKTYFFSEKGKYTFRKRKGMLPIGFLIGVLGLMVMNTLVARPVKAVEICSAQAAQLMRQAGISQQQVERVCELARFTAAPFVISFQRAEEELGYCRITLKLENRSAEYLNQLALSTEKSLFEIFQFHNVLPGTIGYASARSRILLACDEAKEMKLLFHWPASLRVADRAANGARIERYKPVLNGDLLGWASVVDRRK